MLNSIATWAPELPAVADSSIPSTSIDAAGATPLQSAFAELLAEISSPQPVSTTDQRSASAAAMMPVENTAGENAVLPIEEAAKPAPDPSIARGRSNPDVADGLATLTAGSMSPHSKTTDDRQTVPLANLLLLVHNPFQVVMVTDSTQPTVKGIPQESVSSAVIGTTIPPPPVDTTGVTIESGHPGSLANSIQVEVESVAVPPNTPDAGEPTGNFLQLVHNSGPILSSGDRLTQGRTQETTQYSARKANVADGVAPLFEKDMPVSGQSSFVAPESTQQPMQLERPASANTENFRPSFLVTEQSAAQDNASPPPARQGEAAPVIMPDLVKAAVLPGQKQLSQDSSGDGQKHASDSSEKAFTFGPIVPATPLKFDYELTTAQQRPITPVREMPEMPVATTAHRVSIDIGDKDSKVMVTLHERGGDVSVRVHAATDDLKTQLQSSVGSLVESLNRANVSLKNLDFTSGHGTPSDTSSNDRNSSQPNTPQRRNSRHVPVKDATDDSVELSTL